MKRLIALLLAAGALTGCLAPTQYQGDIPVNHHGFAERMNAMCRLELADERQCFPEAE